VQSWIHGGDNTEGGREVVCIWWGCEERKWWREFGGKGARNLGLMGALIRAVCTEVRDPVENPAVQFRKGGLNGSSGR
jgi:hypothetical protein